MIDSPEYQVCPIKKQAYRASQRTLGVTATGISTGEIPSVDSPDIFCAPGCNGPKELEVAYSTRVAKFLASFGLLRSTHESCPRDESVSTVVIQTPPPRQPKLSNVRPTTGVMHLDTRWGQGISDRTNG